MSNTPLYTVTYIDATIFTDRDVYVHETMCIHKNDSFMSYIFVNY